LILSGRDIFAENSSLILILFYPIGIFAGCSNENTVPTILFFIAAIYFYFMLDKKRLSLKIPGWFLPGAISLLAGYFILLFAPSTKVRQDYYNTAFGVKDVSLLTYIQRIENLISRYYQASKILLIALLISTIIFGLYFWIYKKNIPAKSIRNSIIVGLFMLFSFLSLIALVVVPYFEVRSSMLTWFFSFAFIFHVFYSVAHTPVKNIIVVLSAIVVIACVYQSHTIFNLYNAFYDESMTRHYQILSQIETGSQIVQVKPFLTQNSRLLNTRDDYLVYIATTQYSNYYGVKEIQIDNRGP
jgi:hypothetical protein